MSDEPKTMEIVPHAPQGQLVVRQGPTAAKLMTVVERMIDTGNVTPENAIALKEIMGVMVEMRKLDAQMDFVTALKALQKDCKHVVATEPVYNSEAKGGGLRYRFAPYEKIMPQVEPLADKHGFVITFDEADAGPGRIGKVCVLTHISGHQQRNKYSVTIGKGPPGANETQASGAAHSYAKRGALCDAVNIVIEKDTDGNAPDDARMEGADITHDQAMEFKRRVRATKSDEFKFLQMATGKSLSQDQCTENEIDDAYKSIPTTMVNELNDMLAKREATRARQASR